MKLFPGDPLLEIAVLVFLIALLVGFGVGFGVGILI
jgi:hypothetical protein